MTIGKYIHTNAHAGRHGQSAGIFLDITRLETNENKNEQSLGTAYRFTLILILVICLGANYVAIKIIFFYSLYIILMGQLLSKRLHSWTNISLILDAF